MAWPSVLFLCRSTAVSWPGRCSPTHVSAGANIMSTQPSQSCGNSFPRTRLRKSSARTRSCGWPCATSTSWWPCWRARAESRRLTRKPHSSRCSRGTCRTCAPTAPGPATPTHPLPGPAATVQKHGRINLNWGMSILWEDSVIVTFLKIPSPWRDKAGVDFRNSECSCSLWHQNHSSFPCRLEMNDLWKPRHFIHQYFKSSGNPEQHKHCEECTLEASPPILFKINII